jgi:hypothetical protein
MRVDVDTSEITQFAAELRTVAPQTRQELVRETATAVEQIAVSGRARAPRRRPWLSTTEGLRTDLGVVGGMVEGSVYSPRDDRGESVGYRQEFGTSDQAPQPFLLAAFRAGASRYYGNVERIVDDRLRR